MRIRIIFVLAIALVFLGVMDAQRWGGRGRGRGRFGPGMGEQIPLPPGATEKTEYVFARLQYDGFGYGRRGRGGGWSTDYPKADRQFLQGVRRLTRIPHPLGGGSSKS